MNYEELQIAIAHQLECQRVLEDTIRRLNEERIKMKEGIKWLDEFVIEPDEFPGLGDSQWWNEKRQSIMELSR